MQAGLLRDFIELCESESVKNPKNGEVRIEWKPVWRGRARVEHSSGTQTVINNETINTITRKITVRTKPFFKGKLTNLCVKIGEDRYKILSRDERKKDMATIMIVELINE